MRKGQRPSVSTLTPSTRRCFLLFARILPPSWERPPDEGSLAHPKGSVALHCRHGHQELDLRGRREGAGGGIEGAMSPGPLFIAPVDTLREALGPPISHRWLKRPRDTSHASLQSPQHTSERLHEGGRAVKAESGELTTSQVPTPLSTKHAAPLRACLLMELEGIRHTLGPPATVNTLDPRAPSATAPPPPDPLHMA